ncbi:MAG: hypothetical protein P8Y44_14395, partial [Acidobacteriota bacterium]
QTAFLGYVLNSRSFRTPEYQFDKNPGSTRILTIGDSFTAASGGVPYSQHWTKLLQDNLDATGSTEVEVINLGVPGVETGFELRLWQIEGSLLEPDLVILGFCIGNDFPLPEEASHPADTLNDGLRPLRESSHLVRLIENLIRLRRAPEHLRESPEIPRRSTGGYELADYKYDSGLPSYERSDYLEIVARRMRAAHPEYAKRFQAGLDRLTPRLQTFRQEVEVSGARFLVVLIPDEYQLYPELVREAAQAAGTNPQDYDVTRPQRELTKRLQEQGIEILDLLLPFQRAARSQSLFRTQDTHWNLVGNRLAAIEIAEYLTSASTRPPG